MSNEEKEKIISEALNGQDLYKLMSVQNVNHKPHPYMIGPRHIVHASDHHLGSLNEETCKAVRCAQPNCHVPYEDHTSDNVAFLQLLRNGTNDEANVILKALVDELGEKFIDGFAFVETEEKYRIL